MYINKYNYSSNLLLTSFTCVTLSHVDRLSLATSLQPHTQINSSDYFQHSAVFISRMTLSPSACPTCFEDARNIISDSHLLYDMSILPASSSAYEVIYPCDCYRGSVLRPRNFTYFISQIKSRFSRNRRYKIIEQHVHRL